MNAQWWTGEDVNMFIRRMNEGYIKSSHEVKGQVFDLSVMSSVMLSLSQPTSCTDAALFLLFSTFSTCVPPFVKALQHTSST